MRRLVNWLADTARFAGGLFYWNFRKSVYAARRHRGRCPCQNPSDDPIPGRVRCDAVALWHEPARFRAICPLLVQTPEGWRCSVRPEEVRSFWGRALGWLAGTIVVLWLLAVTAIWGALHVGNQTSIGWGQLAWPGRWREIKPMQSQHLFARAIESFRQGRLQEANLMLSSAREIDPDNYDVALMLAQITMFQHSFLFSDDLFLALARDYPAKRERTAITYHDTLLALGRMNRLATFALEMASVDRPRAVVWVRSALLGVRLMPAGEIDRFVQARAKDIAQLAPHARLLMEAELSHRQGRDIEALASLHRRFTGPLNSFYVQYQIERLAELGDAADAQFLLNAQGPLLGEFEQRLTQVRISQLTGDRVLAEGSFRALLRLPLSPARVEQLAMQLLAYPERTFYRELDARVSTDPAFVSRIDGATMWLTAKICEDAASADYWRAHGHQGISPSAYPDFAELDFANWDPLATTSPLHLVNVITFPREIILGLFSRMQAQPNPPAPLTRR
jgi:hypothetical protein